jgi:glycerol-3-phosphate dehydrogenase (NAD(P)+)
MQVEIIGRGAWGGALAALVERGGHKVGIGGDLILIAVPSANFREAARAIVDKTRPVIICTKGMEGELFMSEILAAEGFSRFGVLSGPQFASEVAAGLPTGSTLAGDDEIIRLGRAALGEFYLETTDDVIGVEVCGCGKNAAAIAAGFYSVRARGENERAMMLSRAWREVADFGRAIGARTETFLTLAGTGDLFLSATSTTSRNYSEGVALAKGAVATGTIEGIPALHGIVRRAAALGIPTPVLASIEGLIK